jgi:hypothetical protein
VRVDPLQFLLDGLGRMRGRAQHTEAAGAADGRNDIAAMAEGEERKLYFQHRADRRFHGFVLPAAAFLLLFDASPLPA